MLAVVDMQERVEVAMRDAEHRAWESLSGYKFWMFGYHAARWVGLNQLCPQKSANPFRDLVAVARRRVQSNQQEMDVGNTHAAAKAGRSQG